MKKMRVRILSILLCLIMVAGLMPAHHAHADDEWEEGDNCDFCGQYIWGDWICDCGEGGIHCGPDSDYYDCYEEWHCTSCGEIRPDDYICIECGVGTCCVSEAEICIECGLCIYCVEGMELCYSCGKCALCTDNYEICSYCGLCYDEDCGGMCSEGTDHLCLNDHDGYACYSCGRCLLNEEGEEEVPFCNNCRRCEDCIEKCSYWNGESHDLCLECHDDYEYCPDCNHCYLGDIITGVEGSSFGCSECSRCSNCVSSVCKECGKCFDCSETCERCGEKCLECHEGDSDVCEYCGMCFEGVGHCPGCNYCWECTESCSYCGKCKSCNDDVHCPDCEACGKSVDLCEDCGRCPECTQYCETCHECESCNPDEHCSVCYGHFDSGDLCPDCGACGDCADLCDGCGYCADCANEADHCSACHACAEDTAICEGCGMCDACAKSENRHCGESDCNNCYEDYLYCSVCDKCIECVGEEDYCFDCYQCKAHHTDGACSGSGSHTHKPGSDWQTNAISHWQQCRQCREELNRATHVFNAEKKCIVCGYDAAEPIVFTQNPKDVRTRVSDAEAEADDPLCPNNNTVSFKVTVMVAGKGTLRYQWYYRYEGSEDVYPVENCDHTAQLKGKISGAQSAKLTISVPVDACVNVRQYFCRVTLISADGTVLFTADSDAATLKASHVYNRCLENEIGRDYQIWFKDNPYTLWVWVNQDGGHLYYCCGERESEGDDRVDPMHKTPMPHTYGTPEIVMASKIDPNADTFDGYREFYKYTCLECGAKRYLEKHAHHYEVPIDYADPDAMAFLEANCTDMVHPLRCTVEGCAAVIYEQHEYIPTVYAHPTASGAGQYMLQCRQCEYTLSGRELHDANNGLAWTTDLTLVTARNAAVRIYNNEGPTEVFKSTSLAGPDDVVRLFPQQRDGQKVVGWKCVYTDYLEKVDGKYKTIEISGRRIDLDIGRNDGSWWTDVPTMEEYEQDYHVHGGGWMEFTPIYEECKHENGTKLVNRVQAACMYEGYTGDEVCKDCGQVIGKIGTIIPAPSTEHEGTWELVEGTAVEATCTQRGYTGDFRCSECGDIKKGEDLGYRHGETERRNMVKATCVKPGYAGDTYCKDCNKKLQSGRTLPANPNNHENTTLDGFCAPTCTKTGHTGKKKCVDCGEILHNGVKLPAMRHSWDKGTVTLEPTQTATGTKVFHCTRKGCRSTRTEIIPSLSAAPIASVALTVTAPASGATASSAATTETGCTIANTAWLDEGGNDVPIGSAFETGKIYTIKVELEAADGHIFTSDTVFTLNGAAANVVTLGMESVTLQYSFPAVEEPSVPGGDDTPEKPTDPSDPTKPTDPAEPTEPSSPTEPSNPDGSDVPPSGDGIAIWAVLLVVSAGAVTVIGRKKQF